MSTPRLVLASTEARRSCDKARMPQRVEYVHVFVREGFRPLTPHGCCVRTSAWVHGFRAPARDGHCRCRFGAMLARPITHDASSGAKLDRGDHDQLRTSRARRAASPRPTRIRSRTGRAPERNSTSSSSPQGLRQTQISRHKSAGQPHPAWPTGAWQQNNHKWTCKNRIGVPEHLH